jgi:nitrate/TMAO reductase-like tetraheme cytochrome c subunit
MFGTYTAVRLVTALQQRVDSLHVDTRAPGDTMTVFHPPRDITAVQRVIRWFFSVPQWVQLSGAILAVILGVAALVMLWRQRAVLLELARKHHLSTPAPWKVAGGIAALGVLIALATSGITFFTYSQNNNQFCVSCHTLHDEVYQRFQQSKHHTLAVLRCHDCHDEPLVAEIRQVGLWVLLRPAAVGPHAPVPRAVCANCHIQKDPDSTWKRIVATAGHTIHVSSDTAKALKIECLTCHGVTAHRFVPVGQTCSKSGCHEQTKFQLGKMAGQTSLHCTVCHDFKAPTAEGAALDSAKRAMIPTNEDCFTCHQMQRRMADFIPANDPHKGRCGDCHDPHKQTEPAESWKTCTTSGCHVRPDTLTPFHRGITVTALFDCASCHKAHDWKVKGESCLGCHRDIFQDRRTAATAPTVRPVAFAQATRQSSPFAGSGFRHSLHRDVACTSCHTSTGEKHGALTIRSTTDCLTCHHGPAPRPGGSPMACTSCHTDAELARAPAVMPVVIRTSVSITPKTKSLPFKHAAMRASRARHVTRHR